MPYVPCGLSGIETRSDLLQTGHARDSCETNVSLLLLTPMPCFAHSTRSSFTCRVSRRAAARHDPSSSHALMTCCNRVAVLL